MKPDNRLTTSYLSMFPDEAARSLERLSAEISNHLLESIESEVAANVLGQMLPDYAGLCLAQMDQKKAKPVLEYMTNSGIARIMLTLERGIVGRLISLLTVKDKVSVQMMLKYPAHTVGTLMDTLHFYLTEDITVGAALRQMQKFRTPAGCEIFIVDRRQKLTGVTSAMTLLRAEHGLSLRQVIRGKPPAIFARSRIDRVVSHTAWQQYRVLPVIEHDGGLIGVISYEKVLAASRQQQYKIDHVDPFSSVLDLAKLYWYSVAMLVEMLSGKRSQQK